MNNNELIILLADDDKDDCLLFRGALAELQVRTRLTIVYNGEKLMQLLNKTEQLPDVLFLDLNMPRKNGFACLIKRKQNEKQKQLPVIALSTSFDQDFVTLLYQNGAHHYIRKPNEFSQLKEVINRAITLSARTNFTQSSKEDFVILEE